MLQIASAATNGPAYSTPCMILLVVYSADAPMHAIPALDSVMNTMHGLLQTDDQTAGLLYNLSSMQLQRCIGLDML